MSCEVHVGDDVRMMSLVFVQCVPIPLPPFTALTHLSYSCEPRFYNSRELCSRHAYQKYNFILQFQKGQRHEIITCMGHIIMFPYTPINFCMVT